jgi:Flp pilus assembly pilin Flp
MPPPGLNRFSTVNSLTLEGRSTVVDYGQFRNGEPSGGDGPPGSVEHPTINLLSREPRGMDFVAHFIREEDGQDVVEYGLLIATIAIVVLIGIGIFGRNVSAWFQGLAGRITTTGT